MPKVLIVEDDEKTRRSLKRHLTREQIEVREAENGKIGLEMLKSFPADLILLDAKMPEMSGYEMCKILRTNSMLQDIFVLMISAHAKPEDQNYGLDIGADDYLTKPFDPFEMLRRVKRGLDITYARKIGTRDEETGLFNRPFFSLQLAQEVARVSRESLKLSIALFKIDSLLNLKEQLAPEEILELKKSVGDILVSHSRFTDICAAWNENEFIVLLRSTDLEGAKQFSEKMRKKVTYHEFKNDRQVTISAGVAQLKDTDSNMIKLASTRLLQAEQSGGNCTIAV